MIAFIVTVCAAFAVAATVLFLVALFSAIVRGQ